MSLVFENDSWRDRASCRGKPTEWWYPTQGEVPVRALAICAGCPVKRQCLEFAESSPREQYGIWGGCTGRLRRAERNLSGGGQSRRVTNSQRIREELRVAGSWITARDIQQRTGLSKDVVTSRLSELKRQGLAVHEPEMGAWRYQEVS